MSDSSSLPQSLYCWQWGDRAAPPILMLHGHPGNGRAMEVFAEAVSDRYWAIAPDLRGYGRSRTRHRFAMTDHLHDLEALLDRFEIEQFLILGWSLGGILAMELALRYPERVRGLVLVATAARPRGSHPPVSVWEEVATGIAGITNCAFPGWQWNIDTFGKRSLFRYLVQQHAPATYRYLARAAVPAYLQTSAPARRALSEALQQRYNRVPDLPRVNCPALVMAAQCDRHITCASSLETARAIPKSTWIEYPETAHLFPWEIPQQVRADVNAWLQHYGSL